MKIYLVTQGEYSEYHIVAAYASRELAETHVALLNMKESDEYDPDDEYNQAKVEEWELREALPEHVEDPSWEVCLWMSNGDQVAEPWIDSDGSGFPTRLEHSRNFLDKSKFLQLPPDRQREWTLSGSGWYRREGEALVTHVSLRHSKEAAIKIANELRLMLKADPLALEAARKAGKADQEDGNE